MSAPLLRLAGVSKTYPNGLRALAGLDLDLRAGEVLSLLGPSGCGKSTALRLVAGLDRPTQGDVVWRDGAAPEIGYVFQDATLMPWATIFENVWLPLRLRGRTRAQAAPAIDAALARVGLADVANAFPRQLSGGMRMRASIARALVLRPALLLMDEPFAALDEITRWRLNADLLDVTREIGASVIFVTHSVFESVFLSDRIGVMTPRPGRLLETMTIEQRTRDAAFRASRAYLDACAAASQALERAMETAP